MNNDEPLLAARRGEVLADKVYAVLRTSLLTQQIRPGERLNLAELGRSLHVSNTPLRQALVRLQAEGLVRQEPYRGYTATPPPDETSVVDIFDVRAMVEPICAARAARTVRERGGGEFLQELVEDTAVTRLLAAADRAELGRRDLALHLGLARLAGSPALEETISTLMGRLARLSSHSLYFHPPTGAKSWAEHTAVVAAVLAGDEAAAGTAMRTHLRNSLVRLRRTARGAPPDTL